MNLNLLRSLSTISRSSRSIARRGGNHCRSLRLESLESRELLAATAGSMQIGAGAEYAQLLDYHIHVQGCDENVCGRMASRRRRKPVLPFNIPGVQEPPMDSNGYPIGLGNLPSQGGALRLRYVLSFFTTERNLTRPEPTP